MIKKLLIGTALLLGFSLLVPVPALYAQDPLDPVCGGAGADSTACKGRTTEDPILGQTGVLSRIVQMIVLVTAIASVIMIIVGGMRYIISSGDPSNVNGAKNTILYAVIGLVVAASGQVIVVFVLQKL